MYYKNFYSKLFSLKTCQLDHERVEIIWFFNLKSMDTFKRIHYYKMFRVSFHSNKTNSKSSNWFIANHVLPLSSYCNNTFLIFWLLFGKIDIHELF